MPPTAETPERVLLAAAYEARELLTYSWEDGDHSLVGYALKELEHALAAFGPLPDPREEDA